MSKPKHAVLTVMQFVVTYGIVIYGLAVVCFCLGLGLMMWGPRGGNVLGDGSPTELKAAVLFASTLASSVLAVLILLRILAVIRSTLKGDPFTRQNSFRLRTIGWLLLAGFVIQTAAALMNLPLSTLLLYASPWKGLGAVLMVFIIAQIFDYGVEMRADLEGTV